MMISLDRGPSLSWDPSHTLGFPVSFRSPLPGSKLSGDEIMRDRGYKLC